MDLWPLLPILAVVFIGAVFQASVGFGANVIAQPIVLLLDPSFVPGPVLFANALLSLLVASRDRQAIDQRPVGGAVGGLLFGTTIGVLTIRAASPEVLAIVIAVCVLAMVGLLATDRLRIEPSGSNITLAAVAGGFAGTTAGIGGPPMALVYQRATGPEVRGSLASYFILSSPVVLIGLAIAGSFGFRELGVGVALFPVTGLAFLASGRLLPLVDRGFTRPAILVVSAMAAVLLLAKTATG